jgi:hypothetical protein
LTQEWFLQKRSNAMSRYFERGKRDAEHGVYHPPHDRSFIEELILDPYTRKERHDREDYRDGRRAGERNRY